MTPIVGEGMVAMDVAVFMSAVAACAVNLYYLVPWFRQSSGLGLIRLLRVTGWAILSARFGSVLFTTGDILISIPAAIAVFFLAAGEIAAIFNRGEKGQL